MDKPQGLMARLKRHARHVWLDAEDVSELLGPGTLGRLEAQVARSERGHSGEIRVVVEASLTWAEVHQRMTARQRALELFSSLRVWDTEANNGVLIYLLLADRAIEIVADRAVMAAAPAELWPRLVARMREAFRAGRFAEGLAQAVQEVDSILSTHFPVGDEADNPNELPDRPLVL